MTSDRWLKFDAPVRRSEARHRKPVRLTRRGEHVAAWAAVVVLLALLALVGKVEGL